MKTIVATKTGAGTTYSNQKAANDNYRKLKAESGMNGKIAFSGKAFIWCWRDEAGYNIQLYKSSIPDWNMPTQKVFWNAVHRITIFFRQLDMDFWTPLNTLD